MYNDLTYLSVPLPEDIKKLKWYGDFERANHVIDMRLAKDIPTALRKRLELEKEILARMPLEYIYSTEEAAARLIEHVDGATAEELEKLRDEGAAEWIYVNGQVRYKDDFLENMIKTRPDIASRLKNPKLAEEYESNSRLLDETIAEMKEKGSLEYKMHIRASLKLNKEAEEIGKTIRVHLPIPLEYAQAEHVELLSCSEPEYVLAPKDQIQRTVFMETSLQPDHEFAIEYQFENHMRYVDPKPEYVLAEQPDFYTSEQAPHILFTPYLKALTAEVVGDEKNPLVKARKIYDYITSHVMYSFVRQYFTITDIPEYMASGLKGDCGIYALLFITMCRIAGVPARWQSGLYATPLTIGNHDWAQFYVAPYGWMFADCSFGGAAYRAGAVERWNFYFGNLEPFRIPCCSDFQHEFAPEKKFLRHDPYDNQNGEAEYEHRGLDHHVDYETKKTVVEIEKL